VISDLHRRQESRAPDAAWRLALFILAPQGQSILADYGFTSGALPQKDL
jgi:hypothetical protein